MRTPSNRGSVLLRRASRVLPAPSSPCATGLLFCRLVLAALACWVAVPAAAQPAAGGRYDLVVRAQPLSRALERLVYETRIDLYYDPSLVLDKRANCVMQDATPEDLLRCLLRDTGLDFVRFSSGLYVITEAPETPPLFGRLRGIVLDAETDQPLPNAHVMLAQAATGTTSNEAGMFAFSRLKPGRYQVIAQFIGYRAGTVEVEVPPGGDTQAHVALQAEPVLVAPIVVDGLQWRLPSAGLGQAMAAADEMGRTPSLSGDVLSGLGALPGVRVNDATADIHIQGGETGEHQIRLDGAPVFLPLSFAGFVGPFSPFAIGGITVHKAGFGAAAGSQTSGVIDIDHELSIPDRRRLDLQVDPLSVNARAYVRHGRDDGVQATVMAAARTSLWRYYQPSALRSLLDQWNTPDPFLKVASGSNAYFVADSSRPHIGFSDLHVASRVRFGLLKSLYTSLYFGTSSLGTDVEEAGFVSTGGADADSTFRDRFAWQTGVFQTRYESVLDARTFVLVRLRGSYYRVLHRYDLPQTDAAGTPGAEDGFADADRPDDQNGVHELGAELTVDHALSDRQNVEAGVEFIQTSSRFFVLGTQTYQIEHASSSWRMAGFVEDEISLPYGITLNVGGRMTYLPPRNTFYGEPRVALRLDRARSVVGPWSMRLSGGVYRQFNNQFDVSSRSPAAHVSSTRFWLVADSTIRPPNATHVAAEWLAHPAPEWTLRLEGYHKQQHHLLAIDYAAAEGGTGVDLPQAAFIRDSHGSVSGVGVQLQRKLGAGRAELRYERTVARRAVPGFTEDDLPHTPWDEPHRLELFLDLMPVKNVTFLARWHGVWGRRWGFRQNYYDYVISPKSQTSIILGRNIVQHQLERPEEHRLPPVMQLDLSLAYTHRIGRIVWQARADVLNALDRDNVAEKQLVIDPETYYPPHPNSGYFTVANRPLLPRVVSFALRLSW